MAGMKISQLILAIGLVIPLGFTATDTDRAVLNQGTTQSRTQPGILGEGLTSNRLDHWAFKPPVRPAIPLVRASSFILRNPIDAFLAAGYEKHGLTPVPPISKELLLRRVYLDLVGLPPTQEEL